MNVLVVGSGGREHALLEALRNSPKVSRLFAAPGNGGTRDLAEPVPLRADDVDSIAGFAESKRMDLTVVGPEVPLSLGIVDEFRRRGLAVIGPTAEWARLESSKTFTKRLCAKYGLPTAGFVECDSPASAYRALDAGTYPVVVKADGLAAGKGVVVAQTSGEARKAVHAFMEEKTLGSAGSRLVIEEFLDGEEASFHVFADGTTCKTMVASQDHKRRFDGDQGPNTGGMGAYSVDTILSPQQQNHVVDTLIRPTLEAAGSFTGILYAGLMLTAEGPKLVEYNVRFGDPETQVILPRLETDLLEIFLAMCEGRLGNLEIRWRPGASATVVLVADTYPGKVETGKLISGLEEALEFPDVTVYHAGTRWEDGRVYTAGGRILNVTATGDTLRDAIDKAYRAADVITFDGKAYRSDIGRKGLKRDDI